MKKIILTLLLLIVFPLYASHIVGGEFELLHVSGNTYQLNMILYFDLLHGNAAAKDLEVTASIWRKKDNVHMMDVELPLVTETRVGYTQPACSHGELETDKITYSNELVLSDDQFNDPGGYYISWQRCCRNYSITNIYSDDPAGAGETSAGQTFYLEFPPVVKNGVPFINSSPRLFPPLNDYACPSRPYYVNFTGTDDDRDSLVYTMVTPLNTFSAVALPAEESGPYPDIVWRPGYSLSKIIGGNPDLSITLGGLLQCTPTTSGLFVFAVKIEQYRDNQKIGESRRDFQMLVTDVCAHDSPPSIVGKKASDIRFSASSLNVTFNAATTDADRCIMVQVSDPDSQTAVDNYTENVGIRLIPIIPKDYPLDDLAGFVTSASTATLTHGSVKTFSICFPQCPISTTGTFEIGVIAYDDACSLPETDTLIVKVSVLVPPNSPANFVAPNPLATTATLNEGDQATWPFELVDPDGDSLTIQAVGQGFNLDSAGMTMTILSNVKGKITGTLHWDAFCNIYDFTKLTKFKVQLIGDDLDLCGTDLPAIATFNLTVILPGFADVFIDTDLTSNTHERNVDGLTRKIGQSVSFNVTGTQADNDVIVLGVKGKDFNMSDYGMTYPSSSAAGDVTSQFVWDINCTNVDIRKKSFFSMNFTVLDNKNKCKIPKTDTVEVSVTVVAPDVANPSLVMQSTNSVPIVNNGVSITPGQTVAVSLIGQSPDPYPAPNSLQLSLISSTGNVNPTGYTFANVSGTGSVASPFLWSPDCSIFKNLKYDNNYEFKFNLLDKACWATLGDTITLAVEIKDIESDFSKFLPPNVITPNGDNCNDYFALEGLDEDEEAILNCHRDPTGADNLISFPKDNCTSQFQYIHIFNRWGKQVFKSSDRKFRWYAQSADAGVYYYLIEFGFTQYKGSLSVRE
jgi:CHU_C Type IX secretion signal domain